MADLSHVPRILLLEDDGLIALDVEATLQDAGAGQVMSLARIEDALMAIDASEFDAAVLDLHLGRSGWTYEVARRLQEKGVPFVFSSGSNEVAEAFRNVPLVMKPFSSDQLVAALVDVTGRAVAAE